MLARLDSLLFDEIPHFPASAGAPVTELAGILRAVEWAGALLVSFGIVGIFAVAGAPHKTRNELPVPLFAAVPVSESAANTDAPASSPAANAPRRYPYSVIPGGARTIEELRQAIHSDPVVAMHYADFDFSQGRTITLDHDAAFYVSYRLASGVFWTTERIRLRRGEAIVTDGTNLLRCKSGGRLSDFPLLPVSSLEPTAAEIEAAATRGYSGE